MLNSMAALEMINVWMAEFANPFSRAYAPYFITYLIIAYAIYRKRREGMQFLDFLFPDAIYAQREFLRDALYCALLLCFGIAFGMLLHAWLPASDLSPSWWAMAVGLLLFDAVMFGTHWLQHHVPFLWRFHQLHHAPQQLHVLVGFMHHPVDLLLVMGVFAGMTQVVPGLVENPLLLLFYAAGYHLRHSHIPLHYPRWLGWLLVSPADHQAHHRHEREYYNRNLGFIFSFWERGFCALTPRIRGYQSGLRW